jgi:hypothetical protein
MWPKTFEQRLVNWQQLRAEVNQPIDLSSLRKIEQWWWHSPWQAYYLHWDDYDNWPDPWDLLADNVYCNLARALGIAYTIGMLDSYKIHDVVLVEANGNNLVLVEHGKYILNWDSNRSLNTSPDITNISRQVSLEQILKKIK